MPTPTPAAHLSHGSVVATRDVAWIKEQSSLADPRPWVSTDGATATDAHIDSLRLNGAQLLRSGQNEV